MQARLDTCIEDGIADWTGLECEPPDPDDGLATCEATVDELTTCLDAQYASYNTLGDATCADLEGLDFETPAACGPLQEKCPEFFGEGA
jgi:hypothetical protein